jgi:hypothetical protein
LLVWFQVKGIVFGSDASGAFVDITSKSTAYLPLYEASIRRIRHVEDIGLIPGAKEEFVIIDENEADGLILSLRSIQYDLAWERCRQLQAEDVVVKGKVSFAYSKFQYQSMFTIDLCLLLMQIFMISILVILIKISYKMKQTKTVLIHLCVLCVAAY